MRETDVHGGCARRRRTTRRRRSRSRGRSWPYSSADGGAEVPEVGVFTGYSALTVAQALPEDGEVVACESRGLPAIARRYWEEGGVAHKIDLRHVPPNPRPPRRAPPLPPRDVRTTSGRRTSSGGCARRRRTTRRRRCRSHPEQGPLLALLVRLMGQRGSASRSASSPATARSRWRRPCPKTARSSPATSARTTPPSRGGTGRRPASRTRSTSASPPLSRPSTGSWTGAFAGTFDFAFIDANKEQYDAYYERALRLVRRGGLVALDNVFRHGRVADPDNSDPGVPDVRVLNQKLHHDGRPHRPRRPPHRRRADAGAQAVAWTSVGRPRRVRRRRRRGTGFGPARWRTPPSRRALARRPRRDGRRAGCPRRSRRAPS